MAQSKNKKRVWEYAGLIVGGLFASFSQAAPIENSNTPQQAVEPPPKLSPYEQARRSGRFNYGPSMGKTATEMCVREMHRRKRSIITYQFNRSTRLELKPRSGGIMLLFSMQLDSDVKPYKDDQVRCGNDGAGVHGAPGHLYKQHSQKDGGVEDLTSPPPPTITPP